MRPEISKLCVKHKFRKKQVPDEDEGRREPPLPLPGQDMPVLRWKWVPVVMATEVTAATVMETAI